MNLHVAKNAGWNAGSMLISTAIGLLSIGFLVSSLGAARAGLFSLALGIIGFSGLLDFGLSRAITQKFAMELGTGTSRPLLTALLKRTSQFLFAIGSALGCALWVATPLAVNNLLGIEGELAKESILGGRVVALSLPFGLVSAVLVGALEGAQEFRLISMRRTIVAILQFLLPVIGVLLKPDVGYAIGGLALARMLSLLVWIGPARAKFPSDTEGTDDTRRQSYTQMIKFGAWLSVSNIVGPIMLYADRFYLASIFSPVATAYHAIPLDALSRLTAFPSMLLGAVFPALTQNRNDAHRTGLMLGVSFSFLTCTLVPFVLAASIFSSPLLTLWLGDEFSLNSTNITRWLLVGFLSTAFAQVPYSLLHSHGRTDLTAVLHLIELPIFIVMVIFFVNRYGLPGAALSWSLRSFIDMALLHIISLTKYPSTRSAMSKGLFLSLTSIAIAMAPIISTRSDWLIFVAAFSAILLANCFRTTYIDLKRSARCAK